MEEKYTEIYNSLGDTLEEKLNSLEEKIFLLQMKDSWNIEDYETMKIFDKIKENLEKEINKNE